jgi:transmembrane sensor
LSQVAADWALRQEEGPLSDTEERKFAAWLAEDPKHLAAYENALWALDATARHAGAAEIMEIRNAALAAQGDRRSLWGWVTAGLIAASVVAGLLILAHSPALLGVGTAKRVAERSDPANSNYHTAIGERSSVELPDGSVATLDTDSELRVAYSAIERGVFLLKGQALFEVAKGKPIPFQVYAKSQRITAVGTVFNVRLDGDGVKVSMVEGVVRVRDASRAMRATSDRMPPIREVTLSTGEMLMAEPARPLLVRATDVKQVASWRGGLLVFNDTRLSEAVAEINRYTSRPIAIADSAVGDYRISGVFKSNDPEHFSRAMADVLPISVSHAPDGAPTLRSRGE